MNGPLAKAAALAASILICGAPRVALGEPKDKQQAERPNEFIRLELEQLLETPVVTTTGQAQKLHQAPGIVTVITRDEIIGRSYRSVAEALRAVPGLFMNRDYVLHDVGVRGIWSDSAAQLTATKGPSARALQRWIARAASSLPVPLSPLINTGTSVAATRRSSLSKPPTELNSP